VELIDRFGLLPDAARNLLDIARCASRRRSWAFASLKAMKKAA
jgi:transcription-repair coupling factor (superfamily II helicase)